jgi:hypothetical protein
MSTIESDKIIMGLPLYGRAWGLLGILLESWTRPSGDVERPSECGFSESALARGNLRQLIAHGEPWRELAELNDA